jgi:hypothetical protein
MNAEATSGGSVRFGSGRGAVKRLDFDGLS